MNYWLKAHTPRQGCSIRVSTKISSKRNHPHLRHKPNSIPQAGLLVPGSNYYLGRFLLNSPNFIKRDHIVANRVSQLLVKELPRELCVKEGHPRQGENRTRDHYGFCAVTLPLSYPSSHFLNLTYLLYHKFF